MSNIDLNKAMDWPYPVAYGKENEVEADVLILGGGVAGCHAAIHAAKRGAKVVVVDKGAVIRSGSGGAGVVTGTAPAQIPVQNSRQTK